MEPLEYQTVNVEAQAQIVEKKSRFIGHIRHVETEEQAQTFINQIKKKYWDARHNCMAYSVGLNQPTMRSSDDGEPSQTAGAPILEVICGNHLSNVVIVVTRYFGGTLLGTGGLIRAYTKASKEAVAAAGIDTMVLGQVAEIQCDYTASGKIEHFFGTEGIQIVSTEYGEKVSYEVMIPDQLVAKTEKALTDFTSGAVKFRKIRQEYVISK